MSKAATKVEVRRVHIGYASVDSGMLMIVDPCYVLKDKYAEKHGWKKGYDPATESDYEKAGEFCHSNTPQFRVVRHEGDKVVIDPKPVRTQFDDAEPLTAEQHKQIAYGAVCTTGRGDGEYPVFAVYEGETLVSMEVRFDEGETAPV